MKVITAALTLFTLTNALSFGFTKRQLISADTLYQDITNINNAVLANQAATAAFNGGNIVTTLIEGTPVLASVAAIHVVNRKGFADANLSGPIDEADTQRIVDHTVDTVGNSIPAAVSLLVSKKQQFVASGQQQVTLASLQLLLNDHDTFSAALLAKAYSGNAALNAEANGVVAKIHNAIQGGINAYST